ncbi:hypothetical protein C8F04DRAFT_1179500 [Mycena alexandri]|uniref:Uncharacterized protein n=1 Tax=Mycena alexandri TaxID=1745969 RepID=A0AAD6T3X7_9AGAR|nr:hypothetical protein C8F04DRAFT_1179500 [Mycena alexandri]
MPRTSRKNNAPVFYGFYLSRRRDSRTTAELLGLTTVEIAADAQAWNDAAAAAAADTTTTADTTIGNPNGSKVFGSWGSTTDYTPTATGWDTQLGWGTTTSTASGWELPASGDNERPWGTWTAAEWATWHGGSMAGWPPVAAAVSD